jgi:hypothetical protein
MSHLIPNNSVPSVTQLKPKPVFVMKFRSSMTDEEQKNVCEAIYKSDMNNEYHVLVLRNDKNIDTFEMYNADKIERQEWNTLVNKLN